MLVAFGGGAGPVVLTAALSNYSVTPSSSTGATATLLMSSQHLAHLTKPPSSTPSAYPAARPPSYAYVIVKRQAAIAHRTITAYNARARAVSLSPPLAFAASPTCRYLILPPAAVLETGLVSSCAPAGMASMEEVDASAVGGHYDIGLEGGELRPSEYRGKMLLLFRPDGNTPPPRHTAAATACSCGASCLWLACASTSEEQCSRSSSVGGQLSSCCIHMISHECT